MSQPSRLRSSAPDGLVRLRCERGGSAGRFGLRVPTLAREIGRPIVHEPTPTLEQIRAPIGRLDDLARMIRLFRRPVPERRPEAVRHGRDLQVPEQSRQRHAREWLSVHARKHERAFVPGHARFLQDL